MTFSSDFNMNLLDFEQNKKVQNFVNMMFSHSMMPIINKSTCVNTSKFKAVITKLDISDHFQIVMWQISMFI